MTGPTLLTDISYSEQLIYTGIIDSVYKNTNIFDGASSNAIRLTSNVRPGAYSKHNFWTNIPSAQRRDPNSTSSATAQKMTMDAMESVKLHRNIITEMFAEALEYAIRSNSMEDYLEIMGQTIGEGVVNDRVDNILRALVGAIESENDLVVDSSTEDIETSDLFEAAKVFGDAFGKISVIIMHSVPYWKLVQDQYNNNVTNVADVAIYQGTPATLNRPIIVTDSDALTDDDGSPGTEYKTLLLTQNAATLNVTTPGDTLVATEKVTGNDNISYRVQAQWAEEVKVRGYKFDNGENPTDENLVDSSNWTKVFNQNKNTAGIMIKSQ